MKKYIPLVALLIAIALVTPLDAQVVRNPKLSKQDQDSAQSLAREVGGNQAELIYATRFDVIEKSKFDCLLVVYAKPGPQAKDYFAFVAREGKNYILSVDKQGRTLPARDQFLRIGLRYQPGGASILRVMGAFSDPAKGTQQRNIDYQFNGSDFVVAGQSTTSIPK